MFKTELQVRYCETDRMDVVHHSRYFPWFEVARGEFIKQTTGVSYHELEKMGIWLPLVDCYAKFIEGAKYGDTVEIEVCIAELGVAKCKFSYRVLRKSDGALLTTGYTTHGFTTPALRPLNMKKTYPEIYQTLCALRGEDQ